MMGEGVAQQRIEHQLERVRQQERVGEKDQAAFRRQFAVTDGKADHEEHDQVHAEEIEIGTDIRHDQAGSGDDQEVADHRRDQGGDEGRHALPDGLPGSARKENAYTQRCREYQDQ